MLSIRRLQWPLICSFVLLGPFGNLLLPRFFPPPFRLFYLTLPLSLLFYRSTLLKELRLVALFIPFFAYCALSSLFTHYQSTLTEAYPLWRNALLLFEALFAFGAAFALREKKSSEITPYLIRLYLVAFFLSALLCAVGYCGFYLNKLSLETLNRLSIQTQFSFGLLRFSPGTYPNEYGITASFVLSILLLASLTPSVYTLLKVKKLFLAFFYLLTFFILLAMTTRAAYLSFFLTLIYLTCSFRSPRFLLAKGAFFFALLLPLSHLFSYDLLSLITSSIKAISLTSGSSGMRIKTYLEGLIALDNSSLFGSGFGSQIHIHNVYLQLLVELGIVGFSLLALPLMFLFTKHLSLPPQKSTKTFSDHIIAIGLLHILSFGLTNHNLNHHLTWLTLFFFIHRSQEGDH